MASPSRFTKVGLQGRTGVVANTQDSYEQTFEFPVLAVASAAEQDTGIAAPTKSIQVLSAYLYVNTAEATAVAKTLTVGTTAGSGADALGATSVAATGPIGTPVTAAFVGGGNWSFTLAGADFAELDAVCVVTVLATDA
jgi:hypothetical protein